MRLEIGQRVLLSSGEYSDYSVHGIFIVAKPFDTIEIGKQALAEEDAEEAKHRPNHYYKYVNGRVQTILEREGYLVKEDYIEIYCGDYGRLDGTPFIEED